MPVVAIVTGLSGVGKTWLLQHVMKMVPGKLLSASRLIEQELNRSRSEPVRHDDLRTLDITTNQEALVMGFARAAEHVDGLVVLDAHVVIDTPNGLEFVPYYVFSKLTPSLFIFINDNPQAILQRRLRDGARSRPFRDVEDLARQQSQALAAAGQIAADLSLPFYITPAGDVEGLTALLMKQIEADHG
jgi:adenylate kinase